MGLGTIQHEDVLDSSEKKFAPSAVNFLLGV
jgi:hypothetical protein